MAVSVGGIGVNVAVGGTGVNVAVGRTGVNVLVGGGGEVGVAGGVGGIGVERPQAIKMTPVNRHIKTKGILFAICIPSFLALGCITVGFSRLHSGAKRGGWTPVLGANLSFC